MKLRRLSLLDALTVLVFGAAIVLFVRPGSELHARAKYWLAIRAVEREIEKNWSTLVSGAMPLYEGSAEPQIIEFSDYECPFCRASSSTVDSAVAAGIRVALLHVPSEIHPQARTAAVLAICAAGLGRFLDLHRYFMSATVWQIDSITTAYAANPDERIARRFLKCVEEGEGERLLDRHRELAELVGVFGTPLFASRRAVLRERPSIDALKALAYAP
ncbi:MAG TPA: thioredoxin domain-containing protein [Gemmatimonadaceae bacterium]